MRFTLIDPPADVSPSPRKRAGGWRSAQRRLARRAVARGVLAALAILVVVSVGVSAPKGGRDLAWTHADIKSSAIDRIALIPVVTYDNNIQTENLVETVLGQTLRNATRYRWLSGTTTRELLRAKTGGDSLLRVIKADILQDARLDSLRARSVAALLECSGLLTVRVDRWEQNQVDWNQAGRPSTAVQLKAALNDGSGRVVWTISGGETAEGPYNNPSANPVSVKDTGLDRKPVTGQAGAPAYREVLNTIFTRWAAVFPAKPEPAVTAAPASGTSGSAPADTVAPGK